MWKIFRIKGIKLTKWPLIFVIAEETLEGDDGVEVVEQAPIETSQLILRPYRENDLDDIFDYASSTEVTRFLLWEAHQTLSDSQDFLDWVEATSCGLREKVFFVFAIQLKKSGKVIGSIDFKKNNKFCGQTDYVIGKDYWGRGYMTEAASAIRDWALETFPEIVRLQAYCQPENIGSKRVMEKIGMEYEGLRKKSFVIRDTPVDLIHYALIRDLGRG